MESKNILDLDLKITNFLSFDGIVASEFTILNESVTVSSLLAENLLQLKVRIFLIK
jgi:hypothetical protein